MTRITLPYSSAGYWWHPSNPALRVAGTLTISAAGEGRLELLGALPGPQFTGTIPELHGIASDGAACSLIRLFQTSLNPGSTGFLKAAYHVATVVVGAHVADSAEYWDVYISADGLGGWLGASGLQARTGEGSQIGMVFAQPQPLRSQPSPGVQVESFVQVFTSGSPHAWSIEEVPTIRVSLRKPLKLDDILTGWALPLLDLVSIGLRAPSHIRGITAVPADDPSSAGVQIFRQWIGSANLTEENPLRETMNFSGQEFPRGFGPLVSRWIRLRGEMTNVLATYFGGLNAPPTYIETRFLILAYSIEGYHRLRSNETKITLAEFAPIKRAAVAAAPSHLAELVSSRMTSYVRELTLQDRLDRMIERTEPVLGSLLGAAPRFATVFRRARNENTHLGNRTPSPVDALTYVFLTEAGRYLLEVSLMLDLGFSLRLARQLIHRQRLYDHLIANIPSKLK
jgi:hypothetical protein